MYTIKENVSNETIIKKSKFICNLYKIDSIEQIKEFLKENKEKYPDATHICYAYIYDNTSKASDDGEPNKTAGIPMLNLLQHKKLHNVLAVVIRYFGGIKLGAGGLIRAYQNSIKSTLSDDNIIIYEKKINIFVEANFNNEKQLNYLVKDLIILEKSFKEKIVYKLSINENDYEKFAQLCKSNNIFVYKSL